MVVFDKLVVDNCGKLDIEVSTDAISKYYIDGVKIKRIAIDTHKTLPLSIIPSTSPVYDSSIYTKTDTPSYIEVNNFLGIMLYRNPDRDVIITLGDAYRSWYGMDDEENPIERFTTVDIDPDDLSSVKLYVWNSDHTGMVERDGESIEYYEEGEDVNPWDVTTGGIQPGSDESHVHIILDEHKLDLDVHRQVFYVWVYVEGLPKPDAPCGYDSEYSLGVIASGKLIHSNAMNFINEINGCDIPRNFINFILNYDAFKLAIRAKDYISANDIFLRLTEPKSFGFHKNCKCNG